MTSEKEAILWESEKGRIRCRLCPKLCLISEGRAGFCGVRQNVNGKLISLIYARASSVAVDPIEKKPLFHFYPGSLVYSLGTIGCTFRCKHCQNYEIAYAIAKDYLHGFIDVPPQQTVDKAISFGCSGIALTYNEPTIWMEYAVDIFDIAKEKGLYTVFVTNGFITEEALDLIAPRLNAYRVDIKAFSKESYKRISGIYDFSPILRATEKAFHEYGLHIEIVTLVIPTVNDGEEELRSIASWIRKKLSPEVPWHVTRFYPYMFFSSLPITPLETLEKAREIGVNEGLSFVYIGNIPGHSSESTICPRCRKIAIRRHGYLVTEVNLKKGKCAFCGNHLYVRN